MAKDEKKSLNKNTNLYIAAALVVIAIGATLGFVAADSDDSSSTQTNKTETHSDGEGHSHDDKEPYEFESHSGLPEVAIQSVEEGVDGEWTLNVDFENFEIREDKVDQENVPGEGHAHIYVNGEKVSRLFAEQHTFEDLLSDGDIVRVEINTNDHRPYTHDGTPIDDEFTVGVGSTESTSHSSDDSTMHSEDDDTNYDSHSGESHSN